MIEFVRHELKNGLKVLIHRDPLTPMAVTNLVFNAGSKYDPPEMTGMAHLFEHLMFSGSKNAGSFDRFQQLAGGENNAYTNSDVTNYYQVLPAQNSEVALWLESERMGFLDLNEDIFNIQKRVVLEEYKETCLNEPYGDVWHYLHHLCYKKHPYRWPTIGMTPDHIEAITFEQVKLFYKKFYRPDNAILAMVGNLDPNRCIDLVEKWFGDIPAGNEKLPKLQKETVQTELRRTMVESLVPHPAIYIGFHIPAKIDKRFPSIDLLSDLMGLGKSSSLHRKLVEEKDIFTSIDAYVNGCNDMGLFVIEGKLNEPHSAEEGEEAIWNTLAEIKQSRISTSEMEKLKNTFATSHAFSTISSLHKAMNLSQYENLGKAELINSEIEEYTAVSDGEIIEEANRIFLSSNASVVRYTPVDI